MTEEIKEGRAKYDWDALKQEFFNSDILESFTFIKSKLGAETVEHSGWIKSKVEGWTEEKKVWKQKRVENIQKQADKELMEKLKISLQDLLINKKLLFGLDSKYLEILGRIVNPNPEKPLNKNDYTFFKQYSDSISEIYKRIQIELGLPINIQKLGIGAEEDINKIKIEIIQKNDGNKPEEHNSIPEEPAGV